MRLTVFASGSSGNALLVEAGATRVLLDCGVSCRRLSRYLADRGLRPDDLHGVVLSHEHHDHVSGLRTLLGRYTIPLLATAGTAAGLNGSGSVAAVLASGRQVTIGELDLLPVATAHDAREPVAFVLRHGRLQVGVLTDTGAVTTLLRERLAGSHALLVEANHDVDMLRLGPYPWPLKQRIASRSGHLSNEQARILVESVAHGGLQTVVGMHLSAENNRPELAARELARPLAGSSVRVAVAQQSEPLEVVVIGEQFGGKEDGHAG